MESKLKKVTCGCFQNSIPSVFNPALTYDEEVRKLCYAVNEIINYIDALPDELKEYIQENFHSFVLDAMYNEETETLTLFLKEETSDE